MKAPGRLADVSGSGSPLGVVTQPRAAVEMVALRSLLSASLLSVLAVATGCSGERLPTSPGGPVSPSDVLALDVSCPAMLLVNERRPCIAVARLRNGQAPLVSFDAAWTSTRPDVVSVDALGVARGTGEGTTAVSASYQGRTGTTDIVVRAEDALKVSAAAEQGPFRPGNTVTMYLQGFYSVVSADTAHLSLEVSDQSFTVAATGMTVSRGGDTFVLSSTFQVPAGSTRLCRRVVLRIGNTTLVEPSSDSTLACVPVMP